MVSKLSGNNHKNRFKTLKPEERVLCITTVDKEVSERIKFFVKRTKQVLVLPNAMLDKLQSLKFMMINPMPQYDVQIKDLSKGNQKNEDENVSKPFFRTAEVSKSQIKANFIA